MTRKNFTKVECLTLGNLIVRDSGMNQDEHFSVKELDSEQIVASNFFGTKSVSVRPQAKAKRVIRNFKHEAILLMEEHFNGLDQNFGFKKFIGGSS